MTRRESKPRLGEYVLVARLSDDALGTVYRAIHVRDGRFARLRMLESSELDERALTREISRTLSLRRKRSGHPPGRRETLAIAEGRPYLAWHETSGWTLDAVLASAHARSNPIRIDGALRIAAGVAAALEYVRANAVEGEPAHHGLLWPGFVTISRNAEVWVRGFGLASAVFPSLTRPRLKEMLGPYVAPEVRSNGAVGEQSDIYSLGVLLAELLAARMATFEGPPELAPEDPFSEDVARLVKTLLAEPAARPRSVRAVRLRLQKLLEDCPYERSNADLALDLDDLLTPENGARSTKDTAARVPSPSRGPWPRSAEPGATRSVWALRIAGGVAAVLLLAAVDLAVRKREAPRAVHPSSQKAVASPPSGAAVPPVLASAADALPSDSSPAVSNEQASSPPRSGRRSAWWAPKRERQLAQVWRLRAALSRVAAERLDAEDLANEPFREAKMAENEGARLLILRRTVAAREAFRRAADLYGRAEDLSHQERARVIRVSLRGPAAEAPGPF